MHTQGFSQICIHCLFIAARIIPWKMKQKKNYHISHHVKYTFFQPHHQKESPCIFTLKLQLSVLGYYINTQIWHLISFMTPRLKYDYDLWPTRPSSADLSMLPLWSFLSNCTGPLIVSEPCSTSSSSMFVLKVLCIDIFHNAAFHS